MDVETSALLSWESDIDHVILSVLQAVFDPYE